MLSSFEDCVDISGGQSVLGKFVFIALFVLDVFRQVTTSLVRKDALVLSKSSALFFLGPLVEDP